MYSYIFLYSSKVFDYLLRRHVTVTSTTSTSLRWLLQALKQQVTSNGLKGKLQMMNVTTGSGTSCPKEGKKNLTKRA